MAHLMRRLTRIPQTRSTATRYINSAAAGVSGATAASYRLTEAEEGSVVSVRVSFTDDAGYAETLTSAATVAVAARPNRPATGAPTISGTAQVGETLTADVSAFADREGLMNAVYEY